MILWRKRRTYLAKSDEGQAVCSRNLGCSRGLCRIAWGNTFILTKTNKQNQHDFKQCLPSDAVSYPSCAASQSTLISIALRVELDSSSTQIVSGLRTASLGYNHRNGHDLTFNGFLCFMGVLLICTGTPDSAAFLACDSLCFLKLSRSKH